jgi:cytochrome c556
MNAEKKMRKAIAAAAVIVVLACAAAGVLAQDKAAIIADRQETMKSQGRALATAKGYSEGRVEQAEAIAAVTQLIKTTNSLVDKFPPGTGMAEFPGKSGAKPTIWTEWDKFKEAPKAAIAQEEKLLADIKAGDKAAVGKQAGATWDDGCQVCHRPYRERL